MTGHSTLCVMTNGGFLLECHCPSGKGEKELTHEDWCEDPNCTHGTHP